MSEVVPGPSEDDRDARVVIDAFAAFRDANRETFPAPPVAWVFATARRRQRVDRYRGWLATAAAVLPAILLVLGSTTLLNMAGGDEPRRAGGATAAYSTTPTDSPQASGSRTPGPETSTRGREPTGPRAGSRLNLSNATIELPPAGGCPGGVLDFSGGQATDPGGCGWQIGTWLVSYANLDGIPGQEIVTRFVAGATSGVVALRPPGQNAPMRTVRTMGYVMTADSDALSLDWIGVSPYGLVTVGLSDSSAGGTVQQTREYRWAPSAQAFVRVDLPPEPPATDPEPDPAPTQPEPEPSAPEPSETLAPST